jgi:hypothetical protein
MTETVRVLPQGDQWRLEHKGHSVAFPTRTAALEAAAAAVERAILSADEVRLAVDPSPKIPKQN